jgi:hypothetical protein
MIYNVSARQLASVHLCKRLIPASDVKWPINVGKDGERDHPSEVGLKFNEQVMEEARNRM